MESIDKSYEQFILTPLLCTLGLLPSVQERPSRLPQGYLGSHQLEDGR